MSQALNRAGCCNGRHLHLELTVTQRFGEIVVADPFRVAVGHQIKSKRIDQRLLKKIISPRADGAVRIGIIRILTVCIARGIGGCQKGSNVENRISLSIRRSSSQQSRVSQPNRNGNWEEKFYFRNYSDGFLADNEERQSRDALALPGVPKGVGEIGVNDGGMSLFMLTLK